MADQRGVHKPTAVARFLGLRLESATPDKVVMTMPVTERHLQPFGLLHGGITALVIEELGSVAAGVVLQARLEAAEARDRAGEASGESPADVPQSLVGIEINANHISSVRPPGAVRATARPIHKGRFTQVWDIRVETAPDLAPNAAGDAAVPVFAAASSGVNARGGREQPMPRLVSAGRLTVGTFPTRRPSRRPELAAAL